MSKKKLLKLIQKENIRREIINPVYPICLKSKHPNRSPSIDYHSLKPQNFSSLLSGKFGLFEPLVNLGCLDIQKDGAISDCSQNATISTQEATEILSVMVPK